MSSKPWFAWYSSDYRAKTAHLSFIESEAYRRLIEAYYERRGPLPADHGTLCRIVAAQDDAEKEAIRRVVGEFFVEKDHQLHQDRCDTEIAKSTAYSDAQSQRAHKRWDGGGNASADASASQSALATHIPKHIPKPCLPQPQPLSHPQPQVTPTTTKSKTSARASRSPLAATAGFDKFYAAYPKKEGKQEASDQWKKLAPDQELQATIMTALECQKVSSGWSEKKFIPQPARWLRRRRWEDEVSRETEVADPPLFAKAWEQYPQRNGNNPRIEAREAWQSRLTQGVTPEAMLAGTIRYAEWCRVNGKVDTELVMLASTFYGPGHPFVQAFNIAPELVKPTLDKVCIYINDEGVRCDKAGEVGILKLVENNAEQNFCVCGGHYVPPINVEGTLEPHPVLRKIVDRFKQSRGPVPT